MTYATSYTRLYTYVNLFTFRNLYTDHLLTVFSGSSDMTKANKHLLSHWTVFNSNKNCLIPVQSRGYTSIKTAIPNHILQIYVVNTDTITLCW